MGGLLFTMKNFTKLYTNSNTDIPISSKTQTQQRLLGHTGKYFEHTTIQDLNYGLT